MRRKLLIRAAAIVVLVLLAVVLYRVGKGTVLLLDNRTVEAGGATWQALEVARIRVDRHEEIELYPRDRERLDLSGTAHSITVTAYDQRGRELGAKQARFRLPRNSGMVLLSVPAFFGGAEDWVREFLPGETAAAP